MYVIEKSLKRFSAAHRLVQGYQGKCRYLHGHDYALRVVISSPTLDQYGFVIDFDEVKRLFDAWVQDTLDHGTLVSAHDETLLAFVRTHEQKHFVLDARYQNSTSECIAACLYHRFESILRADAQYGHLNLDAVHVAETCLSDAIYRG